MRKRGDAMGDTKDDEAMFPEGYNDVKETLEIAEKYKVAYGVDVVGFLAFCSGYKAGQDKDNNWHRVYGDTSKFHAGHRAGKESLEETETITADADQSLSFEDLVNAYDKISKPTTAIDVPLPYDPDDFSLV